MAASQPLKITFISHACLKFEGNFGTLICDPWILNEPVYNLSTWKFPAAVIPPEEVAKGVNFLYITHSHEDHFHVPSLDYFSRETNILLPEYDHHSSLRAQTVERSLRKLGFFNIRKIPSWNNFLLDKNTPLTIIPAAKTRGHDWENSGFILKHWDATILNMNDNLNDQELCKEIRERFANIDLAFIQTAGVTMYPGCFRMTEGEMRKIAAQKVHGFADQKRTIEYIKPKRVAPFAGDFCWLDEKFFHNNWANRATPEIFDEMVNTNYKMDAPEVLHFQPTDTWSLESGFVKNHKQTDWKNYLVEIKELQSKFQPKIEAIGNWIESSSIENLDRRTEERLKITAAQITRDGIYFDAKFKINIEGTPQPLFFILIADAESGFMISNVDQEVDQTLHVPAKIWAAILEGKLMWNIIQWVAEAEQHVEYRLDMGRFWFWLEYHVDLNNKVPQVIIEEGIYSSKEPLVDPVKPQWGVFTK